MRLIAILVAVLGSAGVVVWQQSSTQESIGMVSQQVPASVAAAPTATSHANIAATYSSPTPGVAVQPDPFKDLLAAYKNSKPAVTEQPVQQNLHAIPDPFKKFIEEARNERPAALASPFGSVK